MTISSRKQLDKESAIKAIREAAENWPDLIPRTRVPELTGGLYSVGHMANCDSKKNGVKGAFRLGRQMVYPRDTPDGGLVNWLISKLEV